MIKDEQPAHVYCVKYALTAGIIRLSGQLSKKGRFIEARPYGDNRIFPLMLSRQEYSLTEEGAQELFLKLRDNKIASLRKQLAKLQNMLPKFTDNTHTETL